jgi:hypothetical protein
MLKIRSLLALLESGGLDGVFYSLIKKLGFKIPYTTIIEKKKFFLDQKIALIYKNKVARGFYKETYLDVNNLWGGYSSKILGIYELKVQEKIIDLKKKFKLKYLVNFGAGEGYHILGLTKNYNFKKSLAFELSNEGRQVLVKNIMANKLKDKIQVFEKADFRLVKLNLNKNNLKKTLFLIDIEGNEYELIDEENLKYFKNSYFIIEDHYFWRNKKIVNKFYNLLKKYFNVEFFEDSSRNPFNYKELKNIHDDERWLMMSENRPLQMSWILLTPKKRF